MTPDDADAWLQTHQSGGIVPGLDRMWAAMALLDDPQDCAPVIHITGTNAKTSVSRMVAAILEAHGLTSGLYTSPHLNRVTERIVVGGRPIDAQDFADNLAYLVPYFDEVARRTGTAPTYFEIGTILAFNHFAECAVDACVLEVGLGGGFDATNVADARVAVLTNIAVDHADFLGTDPAAICAEKAGIIKSGSRVVTGIRDPQLLAIVDARCREVGAGDLWRLEHEIRLERCVPAHGGVVVDVATPGGRYDDVFVPLLGRHQGTNAALAIAAAEAFFDRPLDPGVVATGLAAVRSPGRLEVVGRNPLVVLDGAHNPAGATVLAAAVTELFAASNIVGVVGVLADKDAAGIVDALAPCLDALVTTTPDSERARPAVELAALPGARALGAEAVDHPAAALARARELAGLDGMVLVTGSLYLIGAVRARLVADDAAPLGELIRLRLDDVDDPDDIAGADLDPLDLVAEADAAGIDVRDRLEHIDADADGDDA